MFGVVLYLHSTSNHNRAGVPPSVVRLSYIFILHQTTTVFSKGEKENMLSYIFILHQTTTFALVCATAAWLSYIFILHQTTTDIQRVCQ